MNKSLYELFTDQAAYEAAKTMGLVEALTLRYASAPDSDHGAFVSALKEIGAMESILGFVPPQTMMARQSTLVKYPSLLKAYQDGLEEGKTWLKATEAALQSPEQSVAPISAEAGYRPRFRCAS